MTITILGYELIFPSKYGVVRFKLNNSTKTSIAIYLIYDGMMTATIGWISWFLSQIWWWEY